MGRPSTNNRIQNTKTNSERKNSYRSCLLGHRALDDEVWYVPTGGTGGSHAPFYVSVLEFHDAFHAHVAAFRALLFQLAEFLIGCQVDREGDN